MTYRDSTLGDVLLNLPTSFTSSAAKLLLGLHVLLAYPVLLWPARACLSTLLGTMNPKITTLALVVVSTSCAVCIPQVAVVFGLVGSVIGSWQVYIFPGLLLLKWSRAWSKRSHLSSDDIRQPLASPPTDRPVAICGFSQVSPYANDSWVLHDTVAVWSTVQDCFPKVSEDFEHLSRNSTLLFCEGVFLIVTGCFCAVICTIVYIYETWLL